MLRTARGAVLVLVLGGLGLTVPEQTTDMLAFLGDGRILNWVSYQAALVILGFSGWYWSRAALTAQYGVWANDADAGQIDWFAFRWTPRLALLATVAIGGTIALKELSFWTAGGAAVIGALAVGLLRWRTLDQVRYQLGDPLSPKRFGAWLHGGFQERFSRLTAQAPGGARLSVPLLTVSLGIVAVGIGQSFTAGFQLHAWLAEVFPGPGVAVLGLGLMIGPLVVLTFVIDGIRANYRIGAFAFGVNRPPVLVPLALYVFVAVPAFTHLHPVRLLDTGLPAKATLPAIFADWIKACAPDGEPIRPVIVAMSGGATRSALWGAAVLDRVLQAQQPKGPALFAVSSVSGGSLGAAAAMSLLREEPVPCRAHGLAALAPPAAGQTPLAGDALGPVLAGWLFGDIPRAFTYPAAALVRFATQTTSRGEDSAAAIERAFTSLWAQARPPGTPNWDNPYLSLFYHPDTKPHPPPHYRSGMPLWFVNGTDATTGNRVITSPIAGVDPDWPFRGARDFHALMHADIRIATAINNSARFPYLEPFGELLPAAAHGPAGALADEAAGSLIDGGYFENEGLQTALDIAEWLARQHPGGRTVLPVIVQATGDGEADVMTPDVMTCSVASDGPAIPATGHSALQVLAPLMGLYHVRGGHSAVLLRQAHDDFCGTKNGQDGRPRFVHFYLPSDHGRAVPLNWVLSDETARFIWTAFSDRQVGNEGQLAVLAKAMAPEASPAPCMLLESAAR